MSKINVLLLSLVLAIVGLYILYQLIRWLAKRNFHTGWPNFTPAKHYIDRGSYARLEEEGAFLTTVLRNNFLSKLVKKSLSDVKRGKWAAYRRQRSASEEVMVKIVNGGNPEEEAQRPPLLHVRRRDQRANSWSETTPNQPLHLKRQQRATNSNSLTIDSSVDVTHLSSMDNLKKALSTESVLSISSTADLHLSDQDCGMVAIRLNYSDLSRMLTLQVLQVLHVHNLPAGSEIWLLIFLLPYPKPLFRTKPTQCSANADISETFQQCILEKDLKRVVVLCQMYSRNLSANDTTPQNRGQTKFRLKDLNLTTSRTRWFSMFPPKTLNEEKRETRGDLQFALSYSPTAQRINIIVMKLRNIETDDGQTPKGLLVRVYLVNGIKVLKKRTSIQTTVNGCAEFNESIMFNLSTLMLNKVYLRASVREAHSSTEFSTIGHVTIGSKRSGKELGHWQRMVDNPTMPFAMWHKVILKTQ